MSTTEMETGKAEASGLLASVVFSFAGIACAGSLFNHIKLKEPLDALGQGIAHIADNDLSFSMGYQKQDELGRLCGAFETMRQLFFSYVRESKPYRDKARRNIPENMKNKPEN